MEAKFEEQPLKGRTVIGSALVITLVLMIIVELSIRQGSASAQSRSDSTQPIMKLIEVRSGCDMLTGVTHHSLSGDLLVAHQRS